MSCGEPDLPFCLEALKNQKDVDHVEILEFRDMIEVDAHNAVYQSFNAAPSDMIRGKVDGDVVLNLDALAFVQRTINVIKSNVWLDPTTHDYFTDDQLHAGLAFFGSGVTFKHQTLTLKCDRDVNNAIHHNCGCLGIHAGHSDEWTGFRYGFHRGLKSQLSVYESVVKAHNRHKDPVRFAAIRGFELAQSDLYSDYHLHGSPPPMDHNYGNPKLRELYDQYKDPIATLPPRTWR